MREPSVTDLSFLKIYASGNTKLMKNFIESFLEKTPKSIQLLEDHLAANDFHSLSRSAHSLKPQLSYMGIKSAHDLIVEIEESAKNQTGAENLAASINSLKEILEEAYSELRSKLNEF